MRLFWEGFKLTIQAIVIGIIALALVVITVSTIGMWVMILAVLWFGKLIISSWLLFTGFIISSIVLAGIWGGLANKNGWF